MDVIMPTDGNGLWAELCVLSLRKNFIGCGEIFSVGAAVKGAYHIKCDDPFQVPRQANVIHKIFTAMDTEPFLLVYDDTILLAPTEDFPLRYCGLLESPCRAGGYKSSHLASMKATGKFLAKLGFPTLNFETHTPRVIEPEGFENAMSLYDWTTQPLQPMSIYGNTVDLPKEEGPDTKPRDLDNLEGDLLSMPSTQTKAAKRWVEERL